MSCPPFSQRKTPTTDRRHTKSSYEKFIHITTQYNRLYESVSTICACYALVRHHNFSYGSFCPVAALSSGAFCKSHKRHSRKENATNKILYSFISLSSPLHFYLCWQPPLQQVSWEATNQQSATLTCNWPLHNRYLTLRSNHFRVVFLVRQGKGSGSIGVSYRSQDCNNNHSHPYSNISSTQPLPQCSWARTNRQPLSQPPPRENSMSHVAGGGFISPERPSEILHPIVLSYQTFKVNTGLQAALLFGWGKKNSLSFNTAKSLKTYSAIKQLHIIYLLIYSPLRLIALNHKSSHCKM